MSDFSYRTDKDGKIRIAYDGQHVVTLKGPKAQRFLSEANGNDEQGLQLLMARVTGNFKRGNERHAANTRKNRQG